MWSEQGQARWWTPDATGRINAEIPEARWQDLRDGRISTDFRYALPSSLAQALQAALDGSGPASLRLAEGLPEAWQRYPFEWLRDAGKPLQDRLAVERHVPRQAQPTTCLASKQTAIFRFWPEEEKEQPFSNLVQDGVELHDSLAKAECFMARADLTQYGLLVVVGHGTEQGQQQPLLADGQPWALPTGRGLPAVVLLLACGNEDGNLLDYGNALLQAGAKAVIAPVGKLDAPHAGAFLSGFLEDWRQGLRLDQAVAAHKAKPENGFSVSRLCLLGQGAIRLGQPQSPEDWPDPRLVEAARQGHAEALKILAGRITLRCYQQDGQLDKAEAQLRECFDAKLHDAKAETGLLHAFDPVAENLPALAQAWLLPLLSAFSEAYDHGLMKKYENLCRDARRFSEAPASAKHYLSKIAYRLGHYPESAQNIAAGLSGLDGPGVDAIRPLGHMLNLLIDLDLPALAAPIDVSHRDCISQYGGGNRDTLNHSRLDREARLALRQGDAPTALARFARKQRQALDNHESGLRELPWLLYAAAWADPLGAEAKAYAQQAQSHLSDPEGTIAAINETAKGNADAIYLMRALALWCWRAKDSQAAGLLLCYAEFWKTWLDPKRDVGPIGLAVFYLHLHGWGGPVPAALPRLEEAEVNLDDEYYWFELAALFALAGNRAKAKHYLDLFQRSRKTALAAFANLPGWIGLPDIQQAEAKRAKLETETLLAKAKPTPVKLLETGLLPL
jgi:hypothetical protein